jgi:aquaglyceroporin related protein, other eukaryote
MARDFAPRLMSFILGYGSDVWNARDYYFWIPNVAPLCGTIFGGFLYDTFIYTGPESPINTPWLGLKALVTGRAWRKDKRDLERGGV